MRQSGGNWRQPGQRTRRTAGALTAEAWGSTDLRKLGILLRLLRVLRLRLLRVQVRLLVVLRRPLLQLPIWPLDNDPRPKIGTACRLQ